MQKRWSRKQKDKRKVQKCKFRLTLQFYFERGLHLSVKLSLQEKNMNSLLVYFIFKMRLRLLLDYWEWWNHEVAIKSRIQLRKQMFKVNIVYKTMREESFSRYVALPYPYSWIERRLPQPFWEWCNILNQSMKTKSNRLFLERLALPPMSTNIWICFCGILFNF